MISATSQDMGVAVEYDLMERHEAFMRRKRKEEAEEAAVRGPSHYKQGNIECIDYLRDSMGAGSHVCEGNVKKYIHRWRGKNGLEDLKKAQVYLNWLVGAVEDRRDGTQRVAALRIRGLVLTTLIIVKHVVLKGPQSSYSGVPRKVHHLG